MSLSKVLQIPRKVDVNGEVVDFPLITVYMLGEIDDVRKAYVTSIAIEKAKEEKLSAADQYNIKIDISSRDFNLSELLEYASTPKGAINVLNNSLKKAGRSKEEAIQIIESLGMIDLATLAQELILQPKRESADPNEQTVASTPVIATVDTTSMPTKVETKSIKPDPTLGFGE